MNSQDLIFLLAIFSVYILYRKIYMFLMMGSKSIMLTILSFIPVIILFYFILEIEIILSASLTLMICLVNYFIKQKDISRDLKAKDSGSISSSPLFVQVDDVENKKISTYPRLTIFKYQDDIIFDSSDFEVINKIFKNKSFSANEIIQIDNIEFIIMEIRFDLLSIFDDYSAFGNTPKYAGNSIPYNIQLFIKVEEY